MQYDNRKICLRLSFFVVVGWSRGHRSLPVLKHAFADYITEAVLPSFLSTQQSSRRSLSFPLFSTWTTDIAVMTSVNRLPVVKQDVHASMCVWVGVSVRMRDAVSQSISEPISQPIQLAAIYGRRELSPCMMTMVTNVSRASASRICATDYRQPCTHAIVKIAHPSTSHPYPHQPLPPTTSPPLPHTHVVHQSSASWPLYSGKYVSV